MQGPVEPIAATVAGEHPPGTVRAMCGRGEANDEASRQRVAEVRHRLAPILLIGKRLALLPRDVLSPFHEAWTLAAGNNLLIQIQESHGFRNLRTSAPRANQAKTEIQNAGTTPLGR